MLQRFLQTRQFLQRRLSLRARLALVLAALSLSLIAAILVAIQTSFDHGFEQYINETHKARMQQLAARLSSLAENESRWQRLLDDERVWLEQLMPFSRVMNRRTPPAGPELPAPLPDAGISPFDAGEPPPFDRPPPQRVGPGFSGGADRGRPPNHVWLLDAGKHIVHGAVHALPVADVARMETLPVLRNEQVIAYIGWYPVRMRDNAVDNYFAQTQHRLLLIIAVASVVLSVLLAWLLARVLARPVRELSAAMHAMTQRQYEIRVPVQSDDELGRLAADFNHMAKTLGEYDASQRQWLADISHELRTPLAVLRGELEAISDRLIPLDQSAIDSLQDEVLQLGRLVDDLHQLAVTGLGALQYRFDQMDLALALQQLRERFELPMSQARLAFTLELPASPVVIRGDRQRIDQMLQNLAQNSIRYTEPGGSVRVRLFVDEGIHLHWDDSAPGVPESDLPHLFTRFHRVENSRQRALGGSGLGLAIVSNIVNAHGGFVCAAQSPLGGLHVDICLPAVAAT